MYCKHCGATRPNDAILARVIARARKACCTVADLEPPPIESEWTPDYQAKIDADIIRAAWKTPIGTTKEQRSLEDLPLFASGKEDQQELF